MLGMLPLIFFSQDQFTLLKFDPLTQLLAGQHQTDTESEAGADSVLCEAGCAVPTDKFW